MAKIKGLKYETMSKTYTVVNQLGQGGAGSVFKVTDEEGKEFAQIRMFPVQ